MIGTVLKIQETDLASRFSAARLRSLVEEAADEGETTVFDLGAVLSISESYADELFGVLVARHGVSWFAEHVRIRSATPSVLEAIARAVQQRLEQSSGSADLALLAARKALEAREGESLK